jgi:serine/threonine-protein kinase RIO1
MAGRQRATFKKRQREVKRLEKQRAKAEKRAARRLEQAQVRVPERSDAQIPVAAHD